MKTRSLRGDDCFAILRDEVSSYCSGKNVIYSPNSGNWGDALIHRGILQFLDDIGVRATVVARPEIYNAVRILNSLGESMQGAVLLTAGCGAWCDIWPGARDFVQTTWPVFGQVVVLPGSFDLPALDAPIGRVRYYRRDEAESRTHVPESKFCHDMAFYLELDVPDRFGYAEVGHFFRNDREEHPDAQKFPHSIDISSIATHLGDVGHFFQLLNAYRVIRTDRMHVAIGGAMLGKHVDLYPSSYWKIPALFESSLRDRYPNVHLRSWPQPSSRRARGQWDRPQIRRVPLPDMNLQNAMQWVEVVAESGRSVRLEGAIAGAQSELKGAALAAVGFDGPVDKDVLSDNGLSLSESFGPFFYVANNGAVPGRFGVDFTVPAKVRLDRLGFRLWDSDESVALTDMAVHTRIGDPTAREIERAVESRAGGRVVTVNDVFERVVVVNLDRRADRMEQMTASLGRAGIHFERFPAIDGTDRSVRAEFDRYSALPLTSHAIDDVPVPTFQEFARDGYTRRSRIGYLEQSTGRKAIGSPGAWAYLKTMREIFEQAQADKIESLLILDDDVVFHKDFSKFFSAAMMDVPSDWSVLQLGTLQYNWIDTWIEWLSPLLYSSTGAAIGSHAQGLRADAFPLLLNEISMMDLPYDIGALAAAVRSGRNFIVYPHLAIQRFDAGPSDIGTSNFMAQNTLEAISKRFRWNLDDYVL